MANVQDMKAEKAAKTLRLFTILLLVVGIVTLAVSVYDMVTGSSLLKLFDAKAEETAQAAAEMVQAAEEAAETAENAAGEAADAAAEKAEEKVPEVTEEVKAAAEEAISSRRRRGRKSE